MKDVEAYTKYPHIVTGSIEEVPRGTIIKCGANDQVKSHGKICVIKCQYADVNAYCLKTRVINLQDARQVKSCKICIRRSRNLRRRKPCI